MLDKTSSVDERRSVGVDVDDDDDIGDEVQLASDVQLVTSSVNHRPGVSPVLVIALARLHLTQ